MLKSSAVPHVLRAVGRQSSSVHALTELGFVPFEARVGRLFVTEGELAQPCGALLEVGPSAASQLQLQRAEDMGSSARKELQQVEEQFDLRLATTCKFIGRPRRSRPHWYRQTQTSLTSRRAM